MDKKRILTNGFAYPWFFSLILGSLMVPRIFGGEFVFSFSFALVFISFLITFLYALFIYLSIDFDKITSFSSLQIFQFIGFILTLLLLSCLFPSFWKEICKN
jgi:hypothetical protein